MKLRQALLAAVLPATALAAAPAHATVHFIDFAVNSSDWSNASTPFGVSPSAVLFGTLTVNDTLPAASQITAINYVTGTKTWTLADILPTSSVHVANGAVDFFNLQLAGNNSAIGFNSARLDDGRSARSCQFCVNFTTTAAVPEPATWAMMLIGFGLVGGALRQTRRSKPQVEYTFA